MNQAVKLFKSAASLGDMLAQAKMGFYYFSGKEIGQNLDLSFNYFKLSAEQGNVGSQYMIGIFYEYGINVECNIPEALKWYNLAAKQGYKSAIRKLKVLKINSD